MKLPTPEKKKKVKKPPSIKKLIKIADTKFSQKVRKIYEPGELLECYTCGRFFPKKKLQCGHFVSRFYKACRWDFDNARPQCYVCNIQKKGDLVRFRQRLLAEIGEKRVLDVEALRDVEVTLTREFLEDLINYLSDIKFVESTEDKLRYNNFIHHPEEFREERFRIIMNTEDSLHELVEKLSTGDTFTKYKNRS